MTAKQHKDLKYKINDFITQYFVVNEFHIYGSSRFGVYEANDTTARVLRLYNFSRSETCEASTNTIKNKKLMSNKLGERLSISSNYYHKFAIDSMATLRYGNKRYEGVNHLGNVLVVYSDKRLIGACNADTALYYKADLIAATDYSPFGAPIKQFYASGDTGCVPYTYLCQSTAVASSFDNYVTKSGNNIIDGSFTWKPANAVGNIDTITVNGNRKLKVNAEVSNNDRFGVIDFEVPAGASCTLTFDMQRYGGAANYNVSLQYFYNSSGSSYSQIGSNITYNTNGTKTFIFTANSGTTKHRLRWFSAITAGRYFTLDNVVITYSDTCVGMNCDGSNGYRFGFNGKEKDNEINGAGNSYDFGERMYDARLGRLLSIDPKSKLMPSISHYSFAINSPICFIDYKGEIPKLAIIITGTDNQTDFTEHKAALEKQGYKVVFAVTGKAALDAMNDNSTPESPISSLILLSHGSPGGVASEGGGIWTESELEITAEADWKANEGYDKYWKENGIILDPNNSKFNEEEFNKAAEGYDTWANENFEKSKDEIVQNFKGKKGIVTPTDIAKAQNSGQLETNDLVIVAGGCNMSGYVPLDNQIIFTTELATETKSTVYGSQGYTKPDHSKNTKTNDAIGTTTPNRVTTGTWNKTDSDGNITDTGKKSLNLAAPAEAPAK